MHTTELEQLGLTRNEAKVYTALLELGRVTSGKICKKTNLFASRVYEALEKLIKKGLVSSFILNKKKHFQAEDPSRLQLFVKEKEDIVKNLVPSLNALRIISEETPKIEVFIGREGIKTVAEGELTAKNISALWASPQFQERFEYYRPTFHKKRIEKKIPMRVIYSNEYKEYSKHLKKMLYTQVKYLPQDLPFTIIIYNDTLLLSFWSKDLVAVRLKDRVLANEFLKRFEVFWKIAKK